MVAACYAIWNEEQTIAASMRSVKAYVDRFIIVDGAYASNPAPGPVVSTDETWTIIERIAHPLPLIYIPPPVRLVEHEARNLYLAAADPGEWLWLLDGDEILYGDYGEITDLVSHPPEYGATDLRVFTTAVWLGQGGRPGYVEDVLTAGADEETYETAAVIATAGWQPRFVRNDPGLIWRPTWIGMGMKRAGTPPGGALVGERSAAAWIINHHVSQPYAGYVRDYAWETNQAREDLAKV
jgi:hypothetical protein